MSVVVQKAFPSRSKLLRIEQRRDFERALGDLVEQFGRSADERGVYRDATVAALDVLNARTTVSSEENFLMLYTWQNVLVVDYLTEKSRWPRVANRLWAAILNHVDWDTDEVLWTREGMVERMGCQPRAVTGVLSELVEFKALIADRQPEPGKRGRGMTRFWINPRVGTHRKGKEERAAARAAAPQIGKVIGFDPSSERRSRAPVVAPVVL